MYWPYTYPLWVRSGTEIRTQCLPAHHRRKRFSQCLALLLPTPPTPPPPPPSHTHTHPPPYKAALYETRLFNQATVNFPVVFALTIHARTTSNDSIRTLPDLVKRGPNRIVDSAGHPFVRRFKNQPLPLFAKDDSLLCLINKLTNVSRNLARVRSNGKASLGDCAQIGVSSHLLSLLELMTNDAGGVNLRTYVRTVGEGWGAGWGTGGGGGARWDRYQIIQTRPVWVGKNEKVGRVSGMYWDHTTVKE